MIGQLRVSIRPDTANYYWLSAAGMLNVSSSPYYIKDVPKEWLETDIKIGRSKQYSGLFREYSAPITFFGDGAKLIKAIFYSKLQNATAYLQVDKLHTTTLKYESFFICALNFNEIEINDGLGGSTVEITLMDNSVASLLRENEAIEYEVPISGSDVVPLKISPILLNGQASWVSVYPLPYATESSIHQVPFTIVKAPVYLTLVNNETLSNTIEAMAATEMDAPKALPYFFRTLQALYNVRLSGTLTVYLENNESSSRPYKIFIGEATSLGIGTNEYIIEIGNVAGNNSAIRVLNFNFYLGNIVANRIYALFVEFEDSSEDLRTVWEGGHSIKVTYEYLTNEITTKGGLRWYKVLESIIKQATNNQATLDLGFVTSTSFELENAPYHTILTSGDSIRSLNSSPYKYPVIKTTLSDIFKDGFARWSIGLSVIGNTVYIRKMEYYFNVNNIIKHLGQPSTIKKQIAKDFLFNRVNVGSHTEEHDKLNGRDDAHTTQVYKMPVKRAVATLDLVTPYKVSPYSIYFTWSDANNSSNQDTKNDSTVFAIDVQPNAIGGYFLPQKYTGSISGISDVANYYNFGETPKRYLLRHKRYLRSMLYGLDNEYITFQTSDKNAALSTTFSGVTVDEDADLLVSQLGSPLFIPVMVDIEVGVAENIIQLIDQKPDGCFVFTDQKGNDIKIFPVDAGMKWGRPDKLMISGLLAPGSVLG